MARPKNQIRRNPICTTLNEELLEKLKSEITTGPVLKRPNHNRRFFLKTDWSKDGMGAVLLQAEVTEEAEAGGGSQAAAAAGAGGHGGQVEEDRRA